MSEETDKISKKSKVKMWLIIFCFLFFVLLFIKPFRKQICEVTNICFYTCDEYSGKTWPANKILPWGTEITCEQREVNKNYSWVYWYKSLFKDEVKPENTKGTLFTKDGVYEDGVLQNKDSDELKGGGNNE